jgi:hypothetical protein
MSVRVDVATMRQEMARRGWNQMALAKKAKISQGTVSSALLGYAIREQKAKAIYRAFEKNPPKTELETLLEQPA